jgi:hypothetical protein
MTLSKNTVRKTTISRVIEAQSGSGSKQDEDDCRCQEKCSQFPGGRELVLLKLQSYAQSTVVSRRCPKLAMKYFGPYKILEKIGDAAYKLELPMHSQVHPVFHISQLKTYTSNYTPVFQNLTSPPQLDISVLEPEAILERRLSKKGNTAITQILVKWSNIP